MPALDLAVDAVAIAQCLQQPKTLLVACLCAQWCGACREYRAAFDALANTDASTHYCFVWIDIETHADKLDDFDVENFPTILIEDDTSQRFFGVVTPQAPVLARLLREWAALPPIRSATLLRQQLTIE